MLAARSELVERIRLGKGSFLELKGGKFAGGRVGGPSQDDLAAERAAFPNSAGGLLVLGVEDRSREVVGISIDRLEDVGALVPQGYDDSVKPPLPPIIEGITLLDLSGAEQTVLRVQIARSLFAHQSSGGYLHWDGSSKRPIPPHQLGRPFQQRTVVRLIRFDETPVPDAGLADVEQNLRRCVTPDQRAHPPEMEQSQLAMAAQDEQGVWRPTVAGALMASRHPEEYLLRVFVQAVVYAGSDVVPAAEDAYQRDAQDITDPLDAQIRTASAFVRKNKWVPARKGAAGGRKDVPQFDTLAVFEASTNAVAHRGFSMAASKVQLRLFQDRLEINLPGMLPNTLTPESLRCRQAACAARLSPASSPALLSETRKSSVAAALCTSAEKGCRSSFTAANSSSAKGQKTGFTMTASWY